MQPLGKPVSVSRSRRGAAVIGSGPNGLTAAITLVRAGWPVTVYEAQPTIGGGVRSAELTLPGFLHDVCSAVHPLAIGSPVFRTYPLGAHGLRWIQPPIALAHPLDGGRAVALHRSLAATAAGLGRDGLVWRRLMEPFAAHWNTLAPALLQPLSLRVNLPLLARFGALAAWPAAGEARALFETAETRALFAGLAAHSMLPLEHAFSSAFAYVLGVAAHARGWPIPEGGSQRIADALAGYLRSLGGTIATEKRIASIEEIGGASPVLCDVAPRELLEIAGTKFPEAYSRRLGSFRPGPGVFKVDWALDAPVPWTAPDCARAGTVHLGGTLDEIAESERAPHEGREPLRPFVLLAQPTLIDPSRAPAGKHIAWAYCHVPNGSRVDMTDRIEAQVERFAPGFRNRILARHTANSQWMEKHNANLVGGDIAGGATDWRQLFLRPNRSLYRTPARGIYLCSASTPPGGGVHGMCGYHAARLALDDFVGLLR